MSDFNVHRALEEAHERGEHAQSRPAIAIAAAVLAVLAAVATMLSHNRSTIGLSQKNEAILTLSRSADQYNYYEAKSIKQHLYQALLDAGTANPKSRQLLQSTADREKKESLPILAHAKSLEAQTAEHERHAELALKAYETFEIAVTLFEVSIVFVSISALAATRALLLTAGGSTLLGAVFLVMGFVQHY